MTRLPAWLVQPSVKGLCSCLVARALATLPRGGAAWLMAVTAALPLALHVESAVAQNTYSGWTYVEDDRPEPFPGDRNLALFDEIRVTLSASPSGPFGIVPESSSVPGATAVLQGPGAGFTVKFGSGVVVGDTFTVQFNAPGGVQFVKADFFAAGGAMHVATMGPDGIIKALNGARIGEMLQAIAAAIPFGAAWGIVDRIHEWGFSLPLNDFNVMAGFYAPDASLLPTVGTYALYRNLPYNPANRNAPIIRNYFRHAFLPSRPLMMPLNLGAVHFTFSNDFNMASANGLYTFLFFGDGCGNLVFGLPTVKHARFTFVFKRTPGQPWMIVQHHSSSNPMDKKLKLGRCSISLDTRLGLRRRMPRCHDTTADPHRTRSEGAARPQRQASAPTRADGARVERPSSSCAC
ncbi:MAG: hypothetical protein KF724_08025 [Phycisphaeraceae bacterium]|nr:hypothetical protein [Phycisphaeraceae bacterium]